MAKRNERTLQMINNFVPLCDEGHSIEEIAKRFDLSTTTVYNYLGEIAEKAGRTRESLLERVFVADHSGRNFASVKRIDKEKFHENFAMLMAGVEAMQSEIVKTIEDIDTMNILMKEEMNENNGKTNPTSH